MADSQPATARSLKPIDMHVHVVGNGSGNSGCWLHVRNWHRPMAAMMLKHIGLPSGALKGDLENLYIQRLLDQVRTSSLGAIVILAQDEVYDDQGRKMENVGSHYVPNEYVLNLAKKHPEFIPAVSIHPARPDALEELDRCLVGGAAIMKILPNCHNINCNDRRFTKFWERMAEAKLPLLAHTGGEHTLPVVKREYADPRVLALPLECGVNAVAAHCAAKSGMFDPDYFHILVGMTKRFQNLYADISAFNCPIRCNHIPECLREPFLSRLVHGSDYPVPVHGHFAWQKGFIDWKTFRRWEHEPNILERDYQLKVAIGFPPEVFTRIHSLLRQPKAQPAPTL